jgi:hypothetical protein
MKMNCFPSCIALSLMLFSFRTEAQWLPRLRLSESDSASGMCGRNAQSIVVGANGDVHVTWYTQLNRAKRIIYRRTSNDGEAWLPELQIRTAGPTVDEPTIAVANRNVYILHKGTLGHQLEVIRSADSGATWSQPVWVFYRAGTNVYSYSIAATDNFVHIVWCDYRNDPFYFGIYHKRSLDGGATWSAETRLSTPGVYAQDPAISIADSTIHVTWWGGFSQPHMVLYKRSSDNGLTWSDSTRVSQSQNFRNPSICVDGVNVHIVGTNPDIFYNRSTNAGLTWTNIQRIATPSGSYISFPSIACTGNSLHLVWISDQSGHRDLYYKKSLDNGIRWTADTVLGVAQGLNQETEPHAAASGASVHVVSTYSHRDSRFVFYKRNPRSNLTNVENQGNLPTRAELLQNYPNPFNPTTTIGFKVQVSGFVILKVFDLLGREVASLVNEKMQPGSYERTFDGGDLASGLYFYRMTSGSFTDVKKLILLR